MRVSKIQINGQKLPVTVDHDYSYLQLTESIAVNEAMRGDVNTTEIKINANNLVELVYEDNTTWLCSPDTLDDLYPGSFVQHRDGEASFVLPSTLEEPSVSRGVVGKVGLKLLNLFTRKKVDAGIAELARQLEEKQLGRFKGLVRVNSFFELEPFKAGDALNAEMPVLLFIHGTNSSTKGSFGELQGTELWQYIKQAYTSSNILAFQHETLTKDPLQNALELVQQLPAGVELHLITHSRGGLVGEILCRFNTVSGMQNGFSQSEIDYLSKEDRNKEVACIQRLQTAYATKNIRVGKFIRVACPAGGTTILGKRLDIFFNIMLNLVGGLTGTLGNPVYMAMKNLLAAVIDTKNDAGVLPGVEAMRPNSPLITLLNNQSSTISINAPVVAISGNCKTALNLKALVILASKVFFFEDNDLVVNTKSMYNGSKRKNNLQLFFDEGSTVDHFSYFKNKKTNNAIILALKSLDGMAIDGFTPHYRGKVDEMVRQAVLGLDGGQYATGTPTGKRPIAIVLPGIMGSNLLRNNKLLWINYLRFFLGELNSLSIDADNIEASSIIKTSYQKLGESLLGEYDVVTFPFDWRLPLGQTALLFNNRIKELLKLKQPIKIIGHSMGGVLMRDFMVHHPDTWKELNASARFRLLFLGSPLGGSFRIINVLFGEDEIINKLSKLDITNKKRDLLKIFSRYPGLLCLLPLTTDANNDFSDTAVWQKMLEASGNDNWPLPSAADLTSFANYRKKILNALPGLDYTNAVYIAGRDKHTPCGYRIDDTAHGDELVLLSTAEGDQSVTWESGIPKEMIAANTVYYADHSHGALSCTPSLFNAIKEILSTGKTALLTRNRPVVRGDMKVFRKPEVTDFDLSPEGIERSLLGITEREETVANELPLLVKVCHGDLKYASFPVLSGHFKNDSILFAEKRIDNLLSGLLDERYKLGLYPGDIGTNEVLLSYQEGFQGAIIAGLGEPGKLTPSELTRTTEHALSKYLLIVNGREKLKNNLIVFNHPLGISSLIIGCGYGGLSVESSVNAILQGVLNANAKITSLYSENRKLIEQVEFVELYEDRALCCYYALNRMGKEAGGTLNITPGDGLQSICGARRQMNVEQGNDWWSRITISREDNKKGEVKGMRFSISTGAAREDLRTIYTATGVVENLVDTISTDNNWSIDKAKAVFELLIPNDFKIRLRQHGNITWVLDKYTAGFPWELLQANNPGAKPMCISAGMIRQLSTAESRLNIEPVSTNTALVIGDPNLKGYLTQLPGALEEAKAVAALLKANGYHTFDLLRSSPEAITPALMSENYKIVHLAGHGVFNADPELKSGMVVGKDSFLTTAEIAQMSTTPELVFVNCCFLGKTDGVAEAFYQSRFKLAANIGTQLIENGVKAVIVAGWAVDDAAALIFARTFYECMFQGYTFGEAVRYAREKVYETYNNKNTWGAYQAYGDPFYKLRESLLQQRKRKYVIAAQAEIDLANLLSDISTGELKPESALAILTDISEQTDQYKIRTPAITETEAMVYKQLNNHEKAIEKFEQLITSGNGAYSFTALEQYCNLRAKNLISKLTPTTSVEEVEKEFEKVIADLNALLHLQPSAERYSLLGSAWKRKISLYHGKKEKTIEAIQQACINYRMAYTSDKNGNGIYAYTNWISLENILVIGGVHGWGRSIKGTDSKDMYLLPPLADVQNDITAMEQKYTNITSSLYWDCIAIPNARLCNWLISPHVAVNGNSKNKKKTKTVKPAMPDSKMIIDAYVKVWNNMGTIDQKRSEIKHLDLLRDALSIIKPSHFMLQDLQQLRDKLEGEIGN